MHKFAPMDDVLTSNACFLQGTRQQVAAMGFISLFPQVIQIQFSGAHFQHPGHIAPLALETSPPCRYHSGLERMMSSGLANLALTSVSKVSKGLPLSTCQLGMQKRALAGDKNVNLEHGLAIDSFGGLRIASTQPCQRQPSGREIQLRQHVHLVGGAGMPPEFNLQSLYLGIGIRIQSAHAFAPKQSANCPNLPNSCYAVEHQRI